MSQSPCHYAALSSESRTALGSNVKTRSILEVTEPMHVIASSCYEKFVKNQTLFSYLKKRGTERPALLLTGQLWGFCVYLFIYFFPLRDKPPQNHNFLRASHHSWQCWSFFFFLFFLSSKDCNIHPDIHSWRTTVVFLTPLSQETSSAAAAVPQSLL